ncbi:MAG: GNAT family N-acetyltransferase [Thermoplasmata archaeon]
MDSREALRALYDREMRQDPVPDPGSRVERLGPIVRVLGKENYVIFSQLDASNARTVVREQVEYFVRARTEVEWKWFGHDRPADLDAILAAEGFVPDEPETLLVWDLREGLPGGTPPPGADLRRVSDANGLRDAVTAAAAAFAPEEKLFSERMAERLRDPALGMFVAYVDGVPVATGRVEMTPGRSFAGLWGGGTSPAYRHRGIYRGLVAVRAALAREAGFRYLTVDARESSRPILERIGFVPLTATRGWVLRPGSGEPASSPAPTRA